MAAFACDRMPTTGSEVNLESDWSLKLNSYTDSIMRTVMLHSCGKLVMWLSQSCNLIGAWKFLSAGPRILPKFTRPFSSSRVGSWDETTSSAFWSLLMWYISEFYCVNQIHTMWLACDYHVTLHCSHQFRSLVPRGCTVYSHQLRSLVPRGRDYAIGGYSAVSPWGGKRVWWH